MNVFTPIKKFIQMNAVNKALTIGSISLIVVLGYLAANYFWQIQPQSLVNKATFEAFKLLLSLSTLILFCLGSKWVWHDRESCQWDNNWQISCLVTGISGCLAGVSLVSFATFAIKTFYGLEIPSIALWYSLIPGAFFLAVAILTWAWKYLSRWISSAWDSLKDTWRRA